MLKNSAEDDATRPAAPVAAETGPRGAWDGLPLGTRLLEFEILDVVGGGGFGIVYRAYDHDLQREVALKEYLPASLARRAGGLRVEVTSPGVAATFATGLRSFVNEARLLAQFDHPSLVKVYRFWEGNGTAYMVMPYHRAPTLAAMLRERGTPVDERWLRVILAQLLDALQVLHDKQCLHRDIAPDNILMLEDERPLLLDFGAARRVLADASRALTVIYKPTYAPIEQHSEAREMKQGPWTDLYALCGVAHLAIVGAPPPSALQRLVQETYEPLARRAAGRFDRRLLEGIDLGLRLRPEERPQSVAAMRAAMGLEPGPATSRTVPSSREESAQAASSSRLVGPAPTPRRPLVPALGLAALVAVSWGVWTGWPRQATAPTPTSAPVSDPARPASGEVPRTSGVASPADQARRSDAPSADLPGQADAARAAGRAEAPAPDPVDTPAAPSAQLERAPAEVPGGPPPGARKPDPRPAATASAAPRASAPAATTAGAAASKPAQSRTTASPRCSELLLRQSLGEPLSPADTEVLKTRCQ